MQLVFLTVLLNVLANDLRCVRSLAEVKGVVDEVCSLSVCVEVDVTRQAYSQEATQRSGEAEAEGDDDDDQIHATDVGHNIYILAHQVS